MFFVADGIRMNSFTSNYRKDSRAGHEANAWLAEPA
jgi:hypothetical protein